MNGILLTKFSRLCTPQHRLLPRLQSVVFLSLSDCRHHQLPPQSESTRVRVKLLNIINRY